MTGEQPMVAVDDLTLAFDRPVLDSVSFTVPTGSFTAVVGPNGAGKTTLLGTVNGTITPDSGTVTVAGRDVASLSSRELAKRVATVPQDGQIGFDFSVRDIVAMGRTPHRSRLHQRREADEEAIQSALERTQISGLADRSVSSVSGGERQRVLLARALAQDAPLLVLDEPTASLDIHHQVRTLELIRELVSTGATALAAIHDLDLAARYCDTIVVISDGTVLEAGDPDTVLTEEVIKQAYGGEPHIHENPITNTPSVTAIDPEE